MYLVFYLFIGTLYASCYNNFFIWSIHGEQFRTTLTFIKLVFPLAMFVYEASSGQYYLLIYLINMVGCVFTGFLLYYHVRNMLKGRMTHEAAKQFDVGALANMKMVLGEKWYLTWISPFVRSRLPHDGIHWQKMLEETTKNL